MSTATIYMPLSRGQSKTAPQVLISPVATYSRNTGPLVVTGQTTGWYDKARAMRKDPTLSMVRQLVVAPAMSPLWNYNEKKGAPEGAAEFVREQLDELRTYLIRTTMYGCIDFGFQAFEKVFDTDDDDRIVLRKMKSLLPDWLEILVNVRTGAYAGLRDWHPYDGWYVQLQPNKTFLHAFDVEGTYWYGKSLLENAVTAYDQWIVANDANERYDRKIAGSHWVIHYPMGISTVNGTEKNNEVIAQEILNAIQSSSGIAVPKKLEEFNVGDGDEVPNAWEVELISDKGATQVAFLDRMNYLDRLKVRALGFPERSILEGKYGTKAEAETHADFAVSNILLRADDLIRDINWYLVDQIMELNYGPKSKGTVRITADAIGADVKRFLRDVYIKMISDPKGFISEMARIDPKALRSSLQIPSDADDDEETDLFETELDKLEKGETDGILGQSGFGDGLRPDQLGEMGRPEQQRSGDGNNGPDRVGNLASRRENRRQVKRQPVRGTASDELSDSD